MLLPSSTVAEAATFGSKDTFPRIRMPSNDCRSGEYDELPAKRTGTPNSLSDNHSVRDSPAYGLWDTHQETHKHIYVSPNYWMKTGAHGTRMDGKQRSLPYARGLVASVQGFTTPVIPTHRLATAGKRRQHDTAAATAAALGLAAMCFVLDAIAMPI